MTTTHPVRIAVAGAGLIGREHIKRVLAAPDAQLAAIVDPAPSAKEQADALQVRWYPDLETMLATDKPDGVIVSLPNALHFDAGMTLIRHGLPMLMEKPVCDTVAQVLAFADAAEQAKVPVLVGHHRRHSPLTQRAKSIIDSGRLGRITAVSGFCWFLKPTHYFEGETAWRGQPGAGVLLLNLIHVVDDLRNLCGDIESVQASSSNAAPHVNLAELLASRDKRRALMQAFDDHGLRLIALNANGNPLHPTDGARQSAVVRDTIRLAAALGVDKVCLMSGLPGGAPADQTPNWIVSSWPPETQRIRDWQWHDVLLPYWHALAAFASQHGVKQLCIEPHGNQLVYNVPTLLKLRAAVGSTIGATLDRSHLMWMGADPLAAIDALGEAIYHVHAKDTRITTARCAVAGLLENAPFDHVAARAWNYVTIGYGHAQAWWKDFCYRLRMQGYDGWLAIEHEDMLMARLEGVRRAVNLLKSVMLVETADFMPQAIPNACARHHA